MGGGGAAALATSSAGEIATRSTGKPAALSADCTAPASRLATLVTSDVAAANDEVSMATLAATPAAVKLRRLYEDASAMLESRTMLGATPKSKASVLTSVAAAGPANVQGVTPLSISVVETIYVAPGVMRTGGGGLGGGGLGGGGGGGLGGGGLGGGGLGGGGLGGGGLGGGGLGGGGLGGGE
jgi:hypothetical protein